MTKLSRRGFIALGAAAAAMPALPKAEMPPFEIETPLIIETGSILDKWGHLYMVSRGIMAETGDLEDDASFRVRLLGEVLGIRRPPG